MLYETYHDAVSQHTEDRNEMQQRLNAETEQAQLDAVEILELSQQIAQLGLDKQDANSKRDAALLELSEALTTIESQKQAAIENVELKAQVEALQQELTAKKALTVNGNDKLAELASKAKESTIEKANIGLARWKEKYGLDLPLIDIPSMPAEPLAMPEIPAIQEAHTFSEDNQVSSEDSETDPSGDRNEAVHEGVEQTAAEETLTLESLKAEIDALKTAHEITSLTVARIAEKANLPIAV